MNEPSEPWVWGTSPPVVITAQVPTRGCPARAVGVASWARDVCPTANALARAPVTADARTERRRNAHLPEVPSGHYHGAARAHHRIELHEAWINNSGPGHHARGRSLYWLNA